MSGLVTREQNVLTRRGRIYAKLWTPSGVSSSRPPIVLFHDSLGCVSLWRAFPEHLSAVTQRPVWAYDRLGFGLSDPYPSPLTLDFVAEEPRTTFADLRAALALERFIAFGHSVGGAMAIATAATFPEACQALITESAQVFVEELTLESIRHAREAFAEKGQLERVKKYHGEKAAWVLGAWTESWLSPGFDISRPMEVLPRVRCPTLALHGAQDEYGTLRHPETIAALAAGPVTSAVLMDCAHVPHREKEGEVLQAISTFLARLEAQPAPSEETARL
jgi:pimeloyl-ACP methyl ester carboxylesterase